MQRFDVGERVAIKLIWPDGRCGRGTYIRWIPKDSRHLVLFEGAHALLKDYEILSIAILDQLAEIV